MATYTFTAHSINVVGGNINVVSSSTFTIVLSDDDPIIGQTGDTGETVSIDGGAPQSYTFLGVGVTDSSEDMAVIEIGGVQYAFNLAGGELDNGNTKVKIANLDDTPIVPCFTPGAYISTPDGPRLVETLSAGDLIDTRDFGPQPIVKVLRTHISAAELRSKPHLRPIKIKAGALGNDVPSADLLVSPQHRMLINDWRAEYLFGEEEVLATAKSMLNDATMVTDVRDKPVEYIHLILETHQIIYANDAPTESVLLSGDFLGSMPLAVCCELRELFPQFNALTVSGQWCAAACMVRGFEGKVL